MKIYLAARFYEKELIQNLYKKLQEKGHQISADWTVHKPIKPYLENPQMSAEYSREDITGATDCDVFILINNGDGGTGMYIEFGAALHASLSTGKPKVYVVDSDYSRSMFYFHPKVEKRKTFEEVLEEI